MNEFLKDYMICALWSSNDPDTEQPIDDTKGLDDISDALRLQMALDCKEFLEANQHMIPANQMGQAGHDFWLTRNGHGAGFWDRNFYNGNEKTLTKAAEAFGEMSLFVNDDGKVYAI